MKDLSEIYHNNYIWRMKFIARNLKESLKNKEFYMNGPQVCHTSDKVVIEGLRNELVHTLLKERVEIAKWCEEEVDPIEYYLPEVVRNMKCFIQKYEEFEGARTRTENITERLKTLGWKDE